MSGDITVGDSAVGDTYKYLILASPAGGVELMMACQMIRMQVVLTATSIGLVR